MNGSIFVNECRIPLNEITKLTAFKYHTKKLSTRHKKYIEQVIEAELQRVAIFQGDVFFCLLDQQAQIDEEKERIKKFLEQRINKFDDNLLKPVTLLQLPASTLERLVFALISAHAKSRGIFRLRGRTFFKPSEGAKKGHLGVETTIISEDDWLKLYFVPTLVVFTEINHSKRSETKESSAIGLCSFRNGCELANSHGMCKFFTPGYMGYVSESNPLSKLTKEDREKFNLSFNDCPRIESVKNVISIKATKRAKNTLNYPDFIVQMHFSEHDFTAQQRIQFRKSTLMRSEDRWEKTHEWINRIFGNNGGNSRITLSYAGVNLHISILLAQDLNSSTLKQPYKAVFIPDQKIVSDQQSSRGSSYGGGYEFNRTGAYDRNDPNRPFDTVEPFLILPNDENTINQVRLLMNSLAEGYEEKKYAKYDKAFAGINKRDGKEKYNVSFVNAWDEEFKLLDKTTDLGYLEAIDDFIRTWNASHRGNPNKIVLVIKPPETSVSNSPNLYYELKSKLDGEGIPNQFITFDTLAKITSPNDAFGPTLQTLWLNIYAKMGGIPWRVENEIGNVHCFIGIGFGLNPSDIGNHIYAGVAHVFDKYGNWVDVASDSRDINKNEYDSFFDRDKYIQGTASFKISQETTESIAYNALSLYKDKQTTSGLPPQNIVLHKLGQIYDCEVLGFLNAAKSVLGNLDMCQLGILQIEQDHLRRLYGGSNNNNRLNHTIERGAGLVINKNKLLLATTGRSRSKYFGIGTPNPLLLTSILPSVQLQKTYGCRQEQFYDIETLGKHVKTLTQLHWGSTRDNIRLPITTLYAQKVAELISKMSNNVDTGTRFHRPWFL